jgi:iron complex transport system ATP-binding protein
MIASVLAQEPEVFLLDEPTAGLDPHYAASLFRLLRELADRGLGILVVTHDINLASMFCDRIVIIDAGTVRTEGAPSTVLSSATLEDVYGPELLVRAHPENGNPMVLPRSGLGRS